MNFHWGKNCGKKWVVGLACVLTACGSCSTEEKDRQKQEPYSPLGISEEPASEVYDLDEILMSGELIAVTIGGPDTYYEYRGQATGMQYELAEQFAISIGAQLRMETVRDTAELLRRLENHEADLVALETAPDPKNKAVTWCGTYSNNPKTRRQWAVCRTAPRLAAALDAWYKPEMRREIQQEMTRRFQPGYGVIRRVRSPFLSRSKGIISPYDDLFRRHARGINWDWRLMAAQCYQESGFDPRARSWAGARGLMQIMPGTAAQLNLPLHRIEVPEENVRAAARYLRFLEQKFRFVNDRQERIWFVLAAYNGGSGHILDAMNLARKYGRNPQRWDEVKPYVEGLTQPRYYLDPVVQYGYMRGTETYQYVDMIRRRWQTYRGVAQADHQPTKAKRKNRFR